jgi:hypothetical protein
VESKQARPSFLKKRSKKLLLNGTVLVKPPGTRITKVFWFFFSKKNVFLAQSEYAAL